MRESKSSLKGERLFWALVVALAVYLTAHHISTVGKLVLVALGFGIMILVHEFGHFIAAKMAGIKVEAFSIGLPPTLVGIMRTEKGCRVRVLPRNSEAGGSQSSLSFTFGRKGKAGETEYRIGLIPFGGYVKMLGQEDIGTAKTVDDPRSYANKSVAARLVVTAAGVSLNALSAVVLFMIVFLAGIKFPPPVIGGVEDGYPAAKAGLRPGDEIIAIDGESKYLDFGDLMSSAALSSWAEETPVTVRHEDGTTEKLYLTSERKPGDTMSRFGIDQPMSLEVGPVSDVNALRAATGLKPGDRITSVNGKDVESFWQLEDIIGDTFTETVSMLAERRAGSDKPVELVETHIRLVRPVESSSGLANVCTMVPRLKVLETAMPSESPVERFFRKLRARFTGRHKGATTDKSGPELEPNDIIVSAGDVNDPTYYELRNITTANEGNDLPLKVIRVDSSGDDRTVDIVVRPVRQGGRVLIGFLPALDVEHPVVAKTIKPDPNAEGLNLPRGSTITTVNGTRVSSFLDMATQLLDIGKGTVTIEYATPDGKAGSAGFDLTDVHKQINLPAAFDATIPFEPLKRTYKANGPVQAVEMGFAKTMRFILTTYATLRSLVEGRVSTENMMGPVGILHASYYIVSREPLIQYVYFIGILSSVIAVFNFLPLPPLDGGLALFLLIEKIKGSPVSAKIQSVLGGAGWILIGALLIFVTFNDIIRWVGGFF